MWFSPDRILAYEEAIGSVGGVGSRGLVSVAVV